MMCGQQQQEMHIGTYWVTSAAVTSEYGEWAATSESPLARRYSGGVWFKLQTGKWFQSLCLCVSCM